MKNKILIVDDHPKVVHLIRSYLVDKPQTEVVGEANTVEDALKLIPVLKPDTVILDMQLPDGFGLDILDNIPQVDFRTIVLTAYPDYAIPALRAHVVDYLLKPLSKEDLWNSLDRVEKTIHEANAEYALLRAYLRQAPPIDRLIIPSDTNKRSLTFEEIIYIRSDGGYTIFYNKDHGHVFTSRSIRYFEEILPANYFFRTHKSFIVNFLHITMIPAGRSGEIQLCHKYWAQLSVRKAAAFRRWYRERTLGR